MRRGRGSWGLMRCGGSWAGAGCGMRVNSEERMLVLTDSQQEGKIRVGRSKS